MQIRIDAQSGETKTWNVGAKEFPSLEARDQYLAAQAQRRLERLGRKLEGEEVSKGYALKGRVRATAHDHLEHEQWKPALVAQPEADPVHPFDAYYASPAAAEMARKNGKKVAESPKEFRARGRREFDAANGITTPETSPEEVKTRRHWVDVADEIYEAVAFSTLPERHVLAAIRLQKQSQHVQSDVAATEQMANELIAAIEAMFSEQERQYRDLRHRTRIDLPQLEPEKPRDESGKFVAAPAPAPAPAEIEPLAFSLPVFAELLGESADDIINRGNAILAVHRAEAALKKVERSK